MGWDIGLGREARTPVPVDSLSLTFWSRALRAVSQRLREQECDSQQVAGAATAGQPLGQPSKKTARSRVVHPVFRGLEG